MEDEKSNMELYHKFLKLLGVKKKNASLKALSELVNAHLSVIPFENISKLYYKKLFNLEYIPSFSQYLVGISENSFGGTCYSNNYYFYKLLEFLGYNVKLCGADMKDPDVHIVIIVTINHKDYLVDVGNAAPYLDPIPLYLKVDYTLLVGSDKYILKPVDSNKFSQIFRIRNGIKKKVYLVKPITRNIEYFNKVISDSYKNTSNFFNCILVTKYISESFFTIYNLELIEAKQNTSNICQISDIDELVVLIERIFNIPSSITKEIVKNIDFSRDILN